MHQKCHGALYVAYLKKTKRRHGKESRKSIWDIREGYAVRGGQHPRELDPSIVDQHAHNSQHGNATMLALNSTPALKSLQREHHLVEGIEESQRLRDTDLQLIHLQGRREARRHAGGGGEPKREREKKGQERDRLHLLWTAMRSREVRSGSDC